MKYYLSYDEYIDINSYKLFLKRIFNDLEFEKNVYELDIIKDKNYCNCNINTITNVNLLAKASNEIYSGEISKNCISKSTFFDKKIKKIIMKKCSGFINSDGIEEDDGEYECLYIEELITSILYSRLVINNITSNLLLFFGYMTTCNFINLLNKKKNESVIFSSYANGVTFKKYDKKLNVRQVFELFYTIICCYANYGYCIQDINLENFMTIKDKFNTVINIYNKTFYFESSKSVCIIDYQTNNIADSYVNLKKYIQPLSKVLDTKIKNELLEINPGSYTSVMKQFINCDCFKPYIIYNKNKCKNYREMVFNVLEHISHERLDSIKKSLRRYIQSKPQLISMTKTKPSKSKISKTKISKSKISKTKPSKSKISKSKPSKTKISKTKISKNSKSKTVKSKTKL